MKLKVLYVERKFVLKKIDNDMFCYIIYMVLMIKKCRMKKLGEGKSIVLV